MKQEVIFPRGIKLHHTFVNRVVNVYESSRNAGGKRYGLARHVGLPLGKSTCLYRIRIIWK